MRKIFIDLGAHIGESTNYFRKHHPEADQFEYYLFEPLPDNIEKLHTLENVTIIPRAASTRNGKARFFTGLSESGSMNEKKRSGGLDGKTWIEVRTIDFAMWLIDLLAGEDREPEIWLKMNIEGEEYPIIQMMDILGIMGYIHKWYVNWHWHKISMPEDEHDKVKHLIDQDRLFPWYAMLKTDDRWFQKSL